MGIRVIQNPITRAALAEIAKEEFGDVVKAVVDIRQGIIAVGGELHADEEAVLMEEHDAQRSDTWGINLYPHKAASDWIEFDSMVNIKPMHGNRSRDIEDEATREKILHIVKKIIQD